MIHGMYTSFSDFPGRYALTLAFNGCNMRCPFCFNMEVVEGEGRVAGFEVMEKLSELKEATPSVGVVFSGGEPTIHPQFEDYAQMLWAYPLAIHTNGMALPNTNPFQAVILSLKDSTVPQAEEWEIYRFRFIEAMRFYKGNRHKEIRCVLDDDRYMNIRSRVFDLSEEIEKYGWKVRYVERR